MPSIHLVERLDNLHRVDRDRDEWESGFWVVGEETAQRLIGGQIYLHSGQDDASHFGGDILSYRVERGGPHDGRIVFRFRAEQRCKNVRAGRDGWGNEKKLVW